MIGKFAGWDDTIVALATPPGIGAIGVLRLSGGMAINIANKLFAGKNLLLQPSHTLHVGYVKSEEKILDEVVVSLFKGPKSYTGEDVVEISCHGSPYVQEQVLNACLQNGARLAKPGEFTQRAFLNGKMDLAQAESVADLIAANSSASQQTALNQIRGGFSSELKVLREELIKFSSLIELELDFSEEDVEFADRKQLKSLIATLSYSIQQLILSFKLGNVIKNGVQVAIIGKPNAGKSTLLNALLNEERAIVSEIAGTTRDTVEEILNINGILLRLIDTAGIRSHSSDVIENIGIEKSREKMRQADVVLLIEDAMEALSKETDTSPLINEVLAFDRPFLYVLNKADLLDGQQKVAASSAFPEALLVSAKQQDGASLVKQHLYKLAVNGTIETEATIVTNARHYMALQQIAASLREVENGLAENIPSDLLSPDIRRSLHYLGEITGEITNEDQLDYIFSKFCIGK